MGVLVILPITLGYLGHTYWVFCGKTLVEGSYGTPDEGRAPHGSASD